MGGATGGSANNDNTTTATVPTPMIPNTNRHGNRAGTADMSPTGVEG